MTMWYLIRAFGMVSLMALTLSTVLGVLATQSQRSARAVDRRIVQQLVHRSSALFGLLALAGHIALSIADSYVRVGVSGTLIPFAAAYRPVAMGVGSIATYVLILVAVTGLSRARFARSRGSAIAWRAIHMSAYLGWLLSLLHGVFGGSDTRTVWAILTYTACTAAVLVAVVWRYTAPQQRRIRHRTSEGHRGPARLTAIGDQR